MRLTRQFVFCQVHSSSWALFSACVRVCLRRRPGENSLCRDFHSPPFQDLLTVDSAKVFSSLLPAAAKEPGHNAIWGRARKERRKVSETSLRVGSQQRMIEFDSRAVEKGEEISAKVGPFLLSDAKNKQVRLNTRHNNGQN